MLLLRGIDRGEAAHALTKVGAATLATAAGAVLAGYLLRVRRWQVLLRGAEVETTFRNAAPILFGAFALNNLLPLRAGDAYRWMASSRLAGSDLSKAFAVLAVERLLDLASLSAMLAILMFVAPPTNIPYANTVLVLVGACGLTSVAALLLAPGAVHRIASRFLRRDTVPRLIRRALEHVADVASMVGILARGRASGEVAGLTLVAWAFEIGMFVIIALACQGTTIGGLYAGFLGTLATLVPSAPGYIGTFDYFAAQGFEVGRINAEAAVAAALLCHLILVVPPTIVGVLGLLGARYAAASAR
jgi:uncharacterized protein (TIRG00374 family)